MQTPFSVEATNLCKHVTSNDIRLDIIIDLNLQVSHAESLAILGSSGSGKSTLLSLLAGLDRPSSGDVRINGISLGELDEDGRAFIRSQYMGFVFQSFQLLPSLNALENVMLPLQLKGIKNAERLAREAIAKVGLTERIRHYPTQLSGGEQQRIAIARAFAPNPNILFADEPTGNLDGGTGKKIIDLLFDMNANSGTALILVTHDMDLAHRCQRVLKLNQGHLEAVN